MGRTRRVRRCLLDTNILLRYFNASSAEHALMQQVARALLAQGYLLYIVPQNLYELWAVATRPTDAGGFGLSIEDANKMRQAAMADFTLKYHTKAVDDEWTRLVVQYRVQGKQVHDTRLVAAMKAHGITHLLTLNPDDFKRFTSEITVLEPSSVLPPSP